MNRRVLIDGYHPSKPAPGAAGTARRGHFAEVSPDKRPPSGPTATERLPKTSSSIQIPPKK